MIKIINLLGSTGSIGQTTLNIIKDKKNFRVGLLTTNGNIKKFINKQMNSM